MNMNKQVNMIVFFIAVIVLSIWLILLFSHPLFI